MGAQIKTALIKQPIGLGDVFYLQKFAYIIKAMGYQIVWPLRDDIMWLKDYMNEINFCPLSSDFIKKDIYYQDHFFFEEENFLFLSPDGFRSPGKRIMESKYALINSSDCDWFDYFHFSRNTKKENELYYNVLNLNDSSSYVFLNKMASIDVKYCDVLDNFISDLNIIELQMIEGFTLFDWCKVIEKAQEIHTVHTSINYVIDKLSINAVVYNMYQGLHSPEVEFIPFKKNPKFIPN